MILIITRHGETDYNVKGILQGQIQSELSENGLDQSKSLADALKDIDFNMIYTSFLLRSIKTAEMVNKTHNKKIVKLKSLNERKLGILEGMLGKDSEVKYPGALEDYKFKPENGENFQDVILRVRHAIQKIIAENSEKTVLLVGHKIVNLAIFSVLLKMDEIKAYKLKQDHTCINIISVEDGNVILKKFNNTDHLKKSGIQKIKEIKGIC